MADGQPPRLNYLSHLFFGVKDRRTFIQGINAAFSSIAAEWRRGIFTGDNLITFGKNLSFLDDQAFMASFERHAGNDIEKGILWRTAVLCWAARNGQRLAGDFVECGCYRGTSARIVCDAIEFGAETRQYWLYDLFEYPEGGTHTRMPELGADLYQRTCARFADLANVRVIKGSVPEILHHGAPEHVAFLHIDMNAVGPEIGALDFFFDRLAPGAVIVLDDFGYHGYRAQRDAERAWFAARGYHVLELPTSQGLIIR